MNKEKLKQRILGEPEDFVSYLEELVAVNRIEDEVALGISKFIIANSPKELTDKQWYTFLEKGLMDNYVEDCERCTTTIPWSEMFGAVYMNEDYYCGYCRHMQEKND